MTQGGELMLIGRWKLKDKLRFSPVTDRRVPWR